MRRPFVTMIGAFLLAGAASGLMPVAAMACSSVPPAIDHVRKGARTIALVRVESVLGDRHYPSGYGVQLIRTIKGEWPDGSEVPAYESSACGDPISVGAGSRMVLGLDFVYGDMTIAPYWVIGADGRIVDGSGAVPPGGLSLNDLLARLGGLPETSTLGGDPASSSGGWPAGLLGLGVIVGLGLASRRPRSARQSP